jgi:D-glucuronyl C5-epimerase C-terminus
VPLLVLAVFVCTLGCGLGLPNAGAASARQSAVERALLVLKQSRAITASAYQEYSGGYASARRSLAGLSGTRYAELEAVLSNLEQIAGAGAFTPSRLPALFLTLARNRQWWTTRPLLSADQRVSFPGSQLVWQYYPGQGIEIQWLGTFGEANGYYLSGHQDAALRQLLAEAIPLAAARAGGIAWEYLFHFDGGAPPWTSGLSQGTALQVLARAYSRFHDPLYLTSAQRALGIFKVAPPAGVRAPMRAGTWYVQYSFAPSDLILNGFIQSLVGLYDYAQLTGDPLGASLFEAGDAEARAAVPRYDTGAWSRYDQYSESTLSYHELLTEFLSHLCERTQAGPPLSSSTGHGPNRAPIAGDQIYCSTARRFASDLHTPPRIALLSTHLPAGARGGVQVSLSKISTVTLTVRQAGKVIWTNAATVEAGKPRLLWVTPARAGAYAVSLRAVDLAGNSASSTGTISVG